MMEGRSRLARGRDWCEEERWRTEEEEGRGRMRRDSSRVWRKIEEESGGGRKGEVEEEKKGRRRREEEETEEKEG